MPRLVDDSIAIAGMAEKRKAELLSEGKPCRKVRILKDTAIKGDNFKAGEEVDFETNLAAACIFQKLAVYAEEPPAKKARS
jgi:hypothetical protein